MDESLANGTESDGQRLTFTGPASATVRVRTLIPSLTPAERRVAEAVLENPARIVSMSISELAEACGTSGATIVRFARSVGYEGYPALRIGLASEAGRTEAESRSSVGLDIDPDDSLQTIVRKVAAADAKAIVDTAENLDVSELRRAVDAIRSARRVEIFGIGASGLVATDLRQKLRRIGTAAFALTDRHEALTAAALLAPDDLVIALSHSGETIDVLEPLRLATEAGCMTVAVTNFLRSSVAKTADIVLTTAVGESAYRSGAIASRVAQLTIVDCMFAGVAHHDQDRTFKALDRTFWAVRGTRSEPSR